jgi:hypothetical protein
MKYAILFSLLLIACGAKTPNDTLKSASGVSKADVQVQTGSDGLTVEQRNVGRRLTEDNKPGSIKHLYVISAYSGQVLIYSTVKGKVTSGSKRLTPNSVAATDGRNVDYSMMGIPIHIGGRDLRTSEVLGDDGTYGSSSEYLFWFDQSDVYHQHYPSGGQIIHISDQPIAVKSVILNMEPVPAEVTP